MPIRECEFSEEKLMFMSVYFFVVDNFVSNWVFCGMVFCVEFVVQILSIREGYFDKMSLYIGLWPKNPALVVSYAM